MPRRSTPVLLVVLALAACDTREQIEEIFRDPTSHETYAASLRRAGLAGNTVAVAWSSAAQHAISQPLGVRLPFREEGFLDPTEPRALAFQLDAERGQRIAIDVSMDAVQDGRVFVDLFRQPSDSADGLFHEADLAMEQDRLEYQVPRSGTFLIRIQPEVLHGGAYVVEIRVLPTLAFPVEGKDERAILSRYGASRDGGRRSHRGVDIFAARGTPALAAAAGRVTRVDTTNLGGYVVWVRDEVGGRNLYYAHLDRQLVREGDRVEPGDTVGLVGNTGNARTTPPHLHFGIYQRRRGALDPWWFIHPQDSVTAVPNGGAQPGEWLRTRVAGVVVRQAPTSRSESVRELERDEPVRVVGRVSGWYRVQLADRVEGYALERSLTSVANPVRVATLEPGAPLRTLPSSDAPVVKTLEEPRNAVNGIHGGFALVLEDDGTEGWVAVQQQDS